MKDNKIVTILFFSSESLDPASLSSGDSGLESGESLEREEQLPIPVFSVPTIISPLPQTLYITLGLSNFSIKTILMVSGVMTALYLVSGKSHCQNVMEIPLHPPLVTTQPSFNACY